MKYFHRQLCNDLSSFPMTTERDKCGLSSLLPMSCRGRAEAFARRLHSRLTSLGSEGGSVDESSWLAAAAQESNISFAQPKHSSDSEMYLEFGLLDSPESPETEIDESELHRLLNNDNLKHSHSEDCHCIKVKVKKNLVLDNKANDSDSSDGPFFDTETDNRLTTVNIVNGFTNGYANGDSSVAHTDYHVTSSDNTQDFNSLSELSKSLKDGEVIESLNGLVQELEDEEHLKVEHNSIDYSKCNGSKTNGHLEEEICTPVDHLAEDKVSTIVQNENKVEIQISTSTSNDESESDERIPRVRRCSSLKTGKTPPGTPGRKKIVRFADVLGLDLADVRTFLDEIPKIPTSAYEDLTDVDLTESTNSPEAQQALKYHGIKPNKLLMPLFQQPSGLITFMDRVRDDLVCLENAIVEDPMTFSIKGLVRVRNLDFHKSVHLRYTFDSWKTYADVQATYVENSCDGFSDKFSFLLYAHTISVGQRFEFAVRFQCKGCQYWDNNKGANYCFQCLPATNTTSSYTPITGVDDWGASFYYEQEEELRINATQVQDLIMKSLDARKKEVPRNDVKRNNDSVLAVFIILMFSFLFMYLQKAIYFT